METDSSYQKVIYQSKQDPLQNEIVDSLNYAPPKIQKYQIFRPEIFQEEVSKKKRAREDEYAKNLSIDEKPILVINQKQLYKEAHYDPPSKINLDKYYKVSKHTESVDEKELVREQSKSVTRKGTRVLDLFPNAHGRTEKSIPNKNEVCKVNGFEYLPPGYIELEPLLMKDEYTFVTEHQEKIFIEQQRKYKQKRLKQYSQRNDLKKREISIYVLSDFEKRVFQKIKNVMMINKRHLSKIEKENIAKELEINSSGFKVIEDNFIQINQIEDVANWVDEEKIRDEKEIEKIQNKAQKIVEEPVEFDIYELTKNAKKKSVIKKHSKIQEKFGSEQILLDEKKRTYSHNQTDKNSGVKKSKSPENKTLLNGSLMLKNDITNQTQTNFEDEESDKNNQRKKQKIVYRNLKRDKETD